MIERITRRDLYLQMAKLMSQRGTCGRLQVGSVITIENRIIATGYNGPVKDDHECNDINCFLGETCKRAIHAEANAIYFAAKNGIKLQGATIYCTHSPCIKCAEAIIQSGIKVVEYSEEFRDTEPLKVLLRAGVDVKKYG